MATIVYIVYICAVSLWGPTAQGQDDIARLAHPLTRWSLDRSPQLPECNHTLGPTSSSPSDPKTWFQAFTHILTNAGVQDGIARYADQIQDQIPRAQKAIKSQLKDTYTNTNPGGCGRRIMAWGSQATVTLNLVPDSIQLSIGKTGLDYQVAVTGVVTIPVSVRQCEVSLVGDHCIFCSWNCEPGTILNINYFAQVDGTATLVVDKNGQPTVSSTPVITPRVYVTGCISDWLSQNLGGDVQGKVTAKVQSIVEEAVKTQIMTESVVPEFRPYPNIEVTYALQAVVYFAGSSIHTSYRSQITAQTVAANGTLMRKAFLPDAASAGVEPPTNWIVPSNETTIFLQGLRVSSTMMQGFLWAGNERKLFQASGNVRILDANFTSSAITSLPRLLVTGRNAINFTLCQGSVTITCAEAIMDDRIAGKTEGDVFIGTTFTNVRILGDLAPFENSTAAGAVFQMRTVDLNASDIRLVRPDFPWLTPDMTREITAGVVKKQTGFWTRAMKSAPFLLPRQLFDNVPLVKSAVWPQHGKGVPPYHGYLELRSYCKCMPPSNTARSIEHSPTPDEEGIYPSWQSLLGRFRSATTDWAAENMVQGSATGSQNSNSPRCMNYKQVCS